MTERPHDLGGAEGLGRVPVESARTGFAARWEALAFATEVVCEVEGVWSADDFRDTIESMAPADYLGASYYERWLLAIETRLAHAGIAERPATASTDATRRALAAIHHGGLALPLEDAAPRRFALGECVRGRRVEDAAYVRIPRYAQGRMGAVSAHRGSFPLPSPATTAPPVEPVYTVAFAASWLWPDADEGVTVSVDLWESDLEPAS